MIKTNFLRILLLFSIFFTLCISFSFATNANNVTTAQTPSNATSNISTVVSTANSVQESSLSFENILNILLITVGVVIILLAIAILIKLKK